MPLLDGISAGYSRSALIDGRLVWLLEIEYAGAIWRWSSRPVEVVGDAGTFVFPGGLDDLNMEDSLAIVGDAGDERSVSLSILWPSPGVAVLIQRGHDLAAAIGQLSLWMEGETYESRMVVIQGLLSQPEYEHPDQPVSFTLTELPMDDLASIVAPEAQVDEVTWPTAPVSATNQRYPCPFFGAAASARRAPGGEAVGLSPAYPLDLVTGEVHTLVISAYPVAATTVTLGTVIDNVYDTTIRTVTEAEDYLGRQVYTVDISAASATFKKAAAWFVTDWNEGGVLANIAGGGRPVTTAGDLMFWLAQRSSVRVDLARFASVAGYLNWPIEAYVDEQASPIGWMVDRLLPILPVSLASGPGGLQPILWRYDARREDAVEHLVNGENCARVGAVAYSAKPADLVQRIVLDYGWDAGNQDYTKHMIAEPLPAGPPPVDPAILLALPGSPTYIPDPRKVHNAFLRGGASRYADWDSRRWRSINIESDLIGSDLTAARVLAWKCRQLGTSPRLVEYDAGQELAWLELGAVVLLTDDEVAISETVALVIGRVMSDTGIWRFKLQILDDAVTARAVDPSLSQDTPPTWTAAQ
jgi:hypothetical protein